MQDRWNRIPRCVLGKAKAWVSKMLSSLIDLYDCIFIQLLFSSARPGWTPFAFVLLGELATFLSLIYDQLNIHYLQKSNTHTHVHGRTTVIQREVYGNAYTHVLRQTQTNTLKHALRAHTIYLLTLCLQAEIYDCLNSLLGGTYNWTYTEPFYLPDTTVFATSPHREQYR